MIRTLAHGCLGTLLFAMAAVVFPSGAWSATAGYQTVGTAAYPNGGMMEAAVLPSMGRVSCVAIDAANGYAYLGTDTVPGRVIKVAVGDGGTTPAQVASLTLNAGEDNLRCAVLDPLNGFIYFGTDTAPGKVVKVAVGAGTAAPTRVGALTLNSLEDRLRCGVIDWAAGYALFGTHTWPGRVVKVALGAPTAPPTRVGTAVLIGLEEGGLMCAGADTAAGYAYFGTAAAPGRVVKLSVGSGASLPVRIGTAVLSTGENAPDRTIMDVTNACAYFGFASNPALLVKVALGAGAAVPARAGAVTLNIGAGGSTANTNPASRLAYLGVNTPPHRIVKMLLGNGSTLPSRIGSLPLLTSANPLRTAAIDSANGFAYLGESEATGGSALKAALSQKGYVKATTTTLTESATVTDVRLYSHVAAGSARAAIYSNQPTPLLLWQSGTVADGVAGGFLTIPITSGSPASLSLTPGSYLLAWQVDSTASIPSLTDGAPQDGILLPQGYGGFPSQLDPAVAARTDAIWTQTISYTPQTAVADWALF
jgi:hypothetical protein